jgi:hypothetical protein
MPRIMHRAAALAGAAALALSLAAGAAASQLTYQPISPGFGGSPFNADYVFGTADANNDHQEDYEIERRDPVQEFASTLQARLLGQISNDIVASIFGEDAQDTGQFRVDSTVIDFVRNGNVINIRIRDESTGSQTSIDVPVPRL